MSGRADYEDRKEAKKIIYQDKIEKAQQKSHQEMEHYNRISSMIPPRTTYFN